MTNNDNNRILLLLTSIVLLLLVVNVGLFFRMNHLQSQVLQALATRQRPEPLKPGTEAPIFQLNNIDQQPVSLSEYRGNKVLIFFSSATCSVCQGTYPSVAQLHRTNPQIQVLMISYGTEEQNQLIIDENELTFPVLMWKDEVAKAYQISSVPFFYFLNEEGEIIEAGSARTLEELQQLTANR